MQILHEESGRFYKSFVIVTTHFPTLVLTRSGSEGSVLMFQSQPIYIGAPSSLCNSSSFYTLP